MKWSENQSKIFDHVEYSSKNLIVIARAGTGKTKTIEESVNRLPYDKRVLLCAFNQTIRDELKNRIEPSKYRDIKTFHQLGYASIAKFWGVSLELDNMRAMKMAKTIVPDVYNYEVRKDVCALVSKAKGVLAESPEELLELMYQFDIIPDQSKGITFDMYVNWATTILQRSRIRTNQINYDDMCYLAAYYKCVIPKYDYVVIDELQDLNKVQTILAKSSVKPSGKIIGIGDDEQAIYTWRGADENAIKNMVTELKADVLSLPITYRCPKKVVELAKILVPDYTCPDSAPEGILEMIPEDKMLENWRPGDFILSRVNAPLVGYCMSLLAKGARAQIIGKNIGDGLISLINKSEKIAVDDFLTWLNLYILTEVDKLIANEREDKAEELRDKQLALISMCEGLTTTDQLKFRISSLFEDVTELSSNMITFSSTHKAKGLEADRVFILENTYRPWLGGEEKRLYYVAVTRAKKELYLVQTRGKNGKFGRSFASESLDKEDGENPV